MKLEKDKLGKLTMALVIVTLAVTAFNTVQINSMMGTPQDSRALTGQTVAGDSTDSKSNGPINVVPTGVPEIYGSELTVSFDDVTPLDPRKADATINIMAQLDRDITLEGEDLDRYIRTVSLISCEYCCRAASIIHADGRPACGCAHSYAMRGLAKYLITEHGDEYTDEQILEELGKWKMLFFPNQITQKAQVLDDQGVELNYINLASNKYRGIEKGTSGGMVGGC